jgi:tartrate-resistant acid phosphatase type 5
MQLPYFYLASLVLVVTACTGRSQEIRQPLLDGQLTFAVVGDYGNNSAAEAAVARLVESWQVDFVATVGDNNYNEGAATTIDQNIGKYYHSFIGSYTGKFGAGSATNRFYPTLGNHDWEGLSCEAACAGPYLEYFQLPGNERYYEVQIGNVGLFVLDSDPREPDGISPDSQQALWLRERLAASRATHKLVFLHHPPYSSGVLHGSHDTLQWPFEAWGATAIFAGHEHNYERLQVGNLPYFVNGLGGTKSYPFGLPLTTSQFRYNKEKGAMLVVVDGDNITYQFVNVQGHLVDSFVQTLPTGQTQ